MITFLSKMNIGRKIGLLLLLISPVIVMSMVNFFAPEPSTQYKSELCTRYCHNTACPHFRQNFKAYQELPYVNSFYETYRANIQLLRKGGDINYQQMNLLVYVIAFPMLTLLWGAFRKSKTSL